MSRDTTRTGGVSVDFASMKARIGIKKIAFKHFPRSRSFQMERRSSVGII